MVHHGEGLRRLVRDAGLVRQLIEDYTKAPLEKQDRAMLDYAVELTREPENMHEEDVQRLREVGWTDVDILDIAQVVAYFAYVNRVADGLGVGVEPEKWEEIRSAPSPSDPKQPEGK